MVGHLRTHLHQGQQESLFSIQLFTDLNLIVVNRITLVDFAFDIILSKKVFALVDFSESALCKFAYYFVSIFQYQPFIFLFQRHLLVIAKIRNTFPFSKLLQHLLSVIATFRYYRANTITIANLSFWFFDMTRVYVEGTTSSVHL